MVRYLQLTRLCVVEILTGLFANSFQPVHSNWSRLKSTLGLITVVMVTAGWPGSMMFDQNRLSLPHAQVVVDQRWKCLGLSGGNGNKGVWSVDCSSSSNLTFSRKSSTWLSGIQHPDRTMLPCIMASNDKIRFCVKPVKSTVSEQHVYRSSTHGTRGISAHQKSHQLSATVRNCDSLDKRRLSN